MPYCRVPFPLIPDWFHGPSDHLTFLFCSMAWCVRLSQLLVGFWMHWKSQCALSIYSQILLNWCCVFNFCVQFSQTFYTPEYVRHHFSTTSFTVSVLSSAVSDCFSTWIFVFSGVTRVGDNRGGNWGCHPSIFSWKTWRPFTITIAFYCFHSGVTPSRVSPHIFFTCPTLVLHYSL